MNKLIIYLLLCMSLLQGVPVPAQVVPATQLKLLTDKEDSLHRFADSMINAEHAGTRFLADSNFVRTLVRALVIKHSFRFPFDSLRTVSRLYAPDSSFRILSWQLKKDQYMYLQKGAIQMKTADGSLKLYPLFDASMFTARPEDSVRSPENWIGAIYYRILQKTDKGKSYYTLLGYDDYSESSNRKWIEVLHFENGRPVFGGNFFSFKEDTGKIKPDMSRFFIEYKKEARAVLNYNEELDMIIYDHLISETEEPERKSTFIPDGDFEGFKWKNGQWVHVNKVFDFKLQDGEFPQEATILDENGRPDEKKLQEQSEKNRRKAPRKN